MKSGLLAFALVAVLGSANAASAATTDDVKWINQCVNDNKGDATADVVLKYCTCMNNKMSDNETQSITQWEKTHVAERKACDKEAGWKWRFSRRHGRACPGHPRLSSRRRLRTWMPGTRPGMTNSR